MSNLKIKHKWIASFVIHDPKNHNVQCHDEFFDSLYHAKTVIMWRYNRQVMGVAHKRGGDVNYYFEGVWRSQEIAITVTKMY